LYAFVSPGFQEIIRERTIQGSTVDRILLTEFPSFPVILPPLPEQHRIAAVLGSLDDKIELNRQMNRTLEEMAQAIFKSWFIDFDGHEDLVESELGLIPRGWEVAPLEDLCSLIRRGIQPKYVDAGGVTVLNQQCIRNNRVSTEKARFHDAKLHPIDKRTLVSGDILINSTGVGTLGRVAQLPDDLEGCICDSHVTVVRANKDNATPSWLATALFLRQTDIENLGHGSTGQTELGRIALGRLLLAIPPLNAQLDYDAIASQLRRRMRVAELESATLSALRDTLLPKLICGEIRVPEAVATMEGSTNPPSESMGTCP
jgi:type I restriction enzyme S subunit